MPVKKTDQAAKKSEAIEEKKTGAVAETKAKRDDTWYEIRPTYYSNFDSDARQFECEIHLPGVKKEEVKLRVLPELFDVKARREHVLFTLTEYFPYELDVNSIQAKYENGLLQLKAKIRDPLADAVDIPLQ